MPEPEIVTARDCLKTAESVTASTDNDDDAAWARLLVAQAQAEALVCIARGVWTIIDLVFDEKRVIEVGVRQ